MRAKTKTTVFVSACECMCACVLRARARACVCSARRCLCTCVHTARRSEALVVGCCFFCRLKIPRSRETAQALRDEIAKLLVTMKLILYGSHERPVDDETAQKLCDEFVLQDAVPRLIANLSSYMFEVSAVLCCVVLCFSGFRVFGQYVRRGGAVLMYCLCVHLFSLFVLSKTQSKKDVASIFNNLLRKKLVEADGSEKFPFCDYVAQKPAVIEMLICG